MMVQYFPFPRSKRRYGYKFFPRIPFLPLHFPLPKRPLRETSPKPPQNGGPSRADHHPRCRRGRRYRGERVAILDSSGIKDSRDLHDDRNRLVLPPLHPLIVPPPSRFISSAAMCLSIPKSLAEFCRSRLLGGRALRLPRGQQSLDPLVVRT